MIFHPELDNIKQTYSMGIKWYTVSYTDNRDDRIWPTF